MGGSGGGSAAIGQDALAILWLLALLVALHGACRLLHAAWWAFLAWLGAAPPWWQ